MSGLADENRDEPIASHDSPLDTVIVVVPVRWHSKQWSTDLGLIVKGLTDLGLRSYLVCPEGSDTDAPFPVHTASQEELLSPEYWSKSGAQAALIITWMGRAPYVQALRAGGLIVLSFGDSDGLLGIRVYPYANLQRMIFPMGTPLLRLRALWHWVKRYVTLYKHEEQDIIHSVQSAHFTLMQGETPRVMFRAFLAYYGLSELDARMRVVPNPVTEEFVQTPVAPTRRNRIVAIGRWDDPQKDAPLMARALARYLADKPDTEVILMGRGGERTFGKLTRAFPNVRYLGAVPRREVGTHLADARIVLFTSRWEGVPNAGYEGLVTGCTLVSTNLPGLHSLCCDGAYGTLATGRRPAQVAAAITAEMERWDRAERDPIGIAAVWRARLAPHVVAQQIVGLIAEATPERKLSYLERAQV